MKNLTAEEQRAYDEAQKAQRAKESTSEQFLQQCEYEARKAGLIFVPSQGRTMTPEAYNHYLHNAE